jgi:hypothetical protein
MSDFHVPLTAFEKAVSLNKREKQKLETSRDAIKRRISTHFKLKGYEVPEFIGQGSFTMGTSIRPIQGYYDLDLGIVLKGLGTDSDRWPKTETIHNLIYNAVDGHTTTRPVRKPACIRVIYKSPYADTDDISYHIDLPVYAYDESFLKGHRKVIAFRGDKQWTESSDPEAFTQWFLEKCKANSNDHNQLKRLVKYLKAWKENQPEYPKMPSGMILTVLAAKNFKPHHRDDVAFINTVKEFHRLLDWDFSIIKPTAPKNDLSDLMTSVEEDNFMKRVEKLISQGDAALNTRGPKTTSKCWERIFGSRFQEGDPVQLFG